VAVAVAVVDAGAGLASAVAERPRRHARFFGGDDATGGKAKDPTGESAGESVGGMVVTTGESAGGTGESFREIASTLPLMVKSLRRLPTRSVAAEAACILRHR